MNLEESGRSLEEPLNEDHTGSQPASELCPHDRFAAIVQILGVYEQIALYAVCRVQSGAKTKTVPVSLVMVEYRRLLDTLTLSDGPSRSFWAILRSLETTGFIKIRQRANRIKLEEQRIPLAEMLAHLASLDFAAELARRTARHPST